MGREFSFESLKERLTTQPIKERSVKSLSFKTFTEQLINDMLTINQAGNAIVYRTAMNRFLVSEFDHTHPYLDRDNFFVKNGLTGPTGYKSMDPHTAAHSGDRAMYNQINDPSIIFKVFDLSLDNGTYWQYDAKNAWQLPKN
ncbi:hypothetical protein [Mucilaginibacter ginsenosidivorans]|uniref:Uncharacterized protein n=1 Tax=Mucilaginibacter ginsenosidivorans TaxID=398053 RepID=A0A5B8UTT8_9SPHI|nr:hypothetical protein [Mucilaginibacter ginsenosidivorans]QEC62155.1 hypothetical protein FRZ54_06010 [Mucilaginibacter ginsenosidivorans]